MIAYPRRGRQPVFSEPTQSIQVWIPKRLIKRVTRAAVDLEMGKAELVAQLLTEGLDRLEAETR